MAGGIKGNQALAQLKRDLAAMPMSMAHDVARQVAPVLTMLAQQAFDGGVNVYGDARPRGVSGKALTLVKTSATRRTVRFVANGTIVRCVLPTRYAKYLIGKYGILPNGKPPIEWTRRMDLIVASAFRARSQQAGAVAA
jgi:hypothetical protein